MDEASAEANPENYGRVASTSSTRLASLIQVYVSRQIQRAEIERGHRFGLYHLHAELDPESGALVERALNAVTQERWRTEHPDGAPSVGPRDSYEMRRADALVDINEPVLTGDGVDAVGGLCVEVIVVIECPFAPTGAREQPGARR